MPGRTITAECGRQDTSATVAACLGFSSIKLPEISNGQSDEDDEGKSKNLMQATARATKMVEKRIMCELAGGLGLQKRIKRW